MTEPTDNLPEVTDETARAVWVAIWGEPECDPTEGWATRYGGLVRRIAAALDASTTGVETLAVGDSPVEQAARLIDPEAWSSAITWNPAWGMTPDGVRAKRQEAARARARALDHDGLLARPVAATAAQREAAARLTPLLTEDGDWLVDPEAEQFHNDIRTLVAAAGVTPVDHHYGADGSVTP